ncbi:NAD(P)/FAD-dependent oxidoreductase [Thalassospira lucentensis]|uniref:NAD(P)/FAD-dependent oxidoreductase n=1 Tax=Thalassospira lucentensis TaxID=168935 RepID=UPI00294301DD|nr:FAD-dependent oxidoreductase [Thalassospira lucentensis]WOI10698.1 FAD-dependent oxidoreductase [Thalassospira lucentensis]
MAAIKIAIIGAGMAGLKAAATLHRIGVNLTVFEKSRGMGGRLATRRTEFGNFNHGAQYVTALHPDFRAFLHQAENRKAAHNWNPNLHRGALAHLDMPSQSITDGNAAKDIWYQGAPQMNKLITPLLAPFEICTQHRITRIETAGPCNFVLHDDLDGEFGPFDGVIVTAPAPQSAELLQPLAARFDPIADVEMAPCWAVMIAFAKPLPTAFDAMIHPDPAISWAARSGDHRHLIHKPFPDLWVLHASPEWSRDNLEEDKERIASRLLDKLRAASGAKLPDVISIDAHRWRYARTITPLGRSHLAGMNGRIIAAGDWCLGARVEAAWRSGKCAAHAMIEALIG